MDSSNPIVERALALSAEGRARRDAGQALAEVAGPDPAALLEARLLLVERLTRRTDDYDASRALTVVNDAIAQHGWAADFTWTPRPQKLFRLS